MKENVETECFGERYLISSPIEGLMVLRDVVIGASIRVDRFYLESRAVLGANLHSVCVTSAAFFLAKGIFLSGLRVKKPGELILVVSSFSRFDKLVILCSRIIIAIEDHKYFDQIMKVNARM